MTGNSRIRMLLIIMLLSFGLAAFLHLTDPNNLPIGLLVVPILLIFFIVYALSLLIIDIFSLFSKSPRRRRTFALLTATMTGTVLVLQSTGGLIINDIIIISVIVIVSLLYVSKF